MSRRAEELIMMSRLISRLSAISIKTGALPFFSWSLAPRVSHEPAAEEIKIVDVLSQVDTQDLRQLISSEVSAGKRVFFMGEHHEQPRVLAAQLTILDELIKQGSLKEKTVVLVAEQFNVLQQGMLTSFGTPANDVQHADDENNAASTLLEAYTKDAGEGFDLSHYMPLLLYARFNRVTIWGGFPPRAWARVVMKEGLEALKMQQCEGLRTIGFTRWSDLTCSPQHAAYLRSMISGDPPAVVEHDTNGDNTVPDPQKGLHPAQAFKDAVLAFVIDSRLRDCSDEALIMVVTGSGHCEYGFGAPERLREVGREQTCILVCKSNEQSTIWKGDRWGSEAGKTDRVMADAVLCYEQV